MKVAMRKLFLLFVAVSIHAQQTPQPPLEGLSDSEVAHFELLVDGSNHFAFDAYQELNKQMAGNFVFSPYNITSGLGLAAIGSKDQTALQFQHLFHYSLPLLLFQGDLVASLKRGNGAKVFIANGIWIDQKITVLPAFKQSILRNYRFSLINCDFNQPLQTIQKINEIISKETEGKIHQLLLSQDVTSGTKMLLTMGAHLQAKWDVPFNRYENRKLQPFRVTKHRTSQVEMFFVKSPLDYLDENQFEMIDIPFEKTGPTYVLSLFVPKLTSTLDELEKAFTYENWKKWKMNIKKRKIFLSIPSFRIEKRLDLKNLLKSLGLTEAFNQNANFGNLTNEKGIYINKVIHKTSIKLDDKGVNVSIAKQVKIQTSNQEKEDFYELTIDRPFIFVICDQQSDTLLFMGRVILP